MSEPRAADVPGENLYPIAPLAEFPPGTRRIVDVHGKSIGVFNVDGEFFALRNRCPHQGGPLCAGQTTGLSTARFCGDAPPEREWARYGEIIRCPWHAWEFDLRTGKAVFGPNWRVATYRVVADGTESRAPEGVPGPVETFRTVERRGTVYVDVPA